MENEIFTTFEPNQTQPVPVTSQPHVASQKTVKTLPLVLGGLLVVTVIGVGAYYLGTQAPRTTIQPKDILVMASPDPTSNLKACTEESKICSDGSSVGRVGPNCEFAECANTEAVDDSKNWNSYTNTTYGYSVRYPKEWKALALVADAGEIKALPNSMLVDLQSPELLLGNATFGVLGLVPQPLQNQVVSKETIKGKEVTVFTITVHNMLSKSYYFPLSTGEYLDVLTRPISSENETIFQEIIESIEVK